MNDDSGALPAGIGPAETSLAGEPGAAFTPAPDRLAVPAPWPAYGLPEPIGGGYQRKSILFVAWRDLANRQAGGSEVLVDRLASGVLARGHYDLAFYQLSIRNIANYSPPVVDLEPGEMAESEILLRLANIAAGEGAAADPAALDDLVVSGLVQKAVQRPGSNVEGRDPDEIVAALSSRPGPERILDLMLRTGPYGDGFGADASGLSLEVLEGAPHGVDLGPLQPRIPEVLRTPSGKVELAPEPIAADVARLRATVARSRNGEASPTSEEATMIAVTTASCHR